MTKVFGFFKSRLLMAMMLTLAFGPLVPLSGAAFAQSSDLAVIADTGDVFGGILAQASDGIVTAPAGEVIAQAVDVDPLAPSTWFQSAASVFAIGSVFAGWVVKLATALGKEWFRTNGQATVYLSAGISVFIAGIGGYFAMGYLTGAGGFAGALQAAFMALLSWLGANASAKYDRQAAASAASRVERARTNLL
jgi:hypothetical protein